VPVLVDGRKDLVRAMEGPGLGDGMKHRYDEGVVGTVLRLFSLPGKCKQVVIPDTTTETRWLRSLEVWRA
jgi:hypothetical protein